MSQNNSIPLPPPALQEATKNSTSVWQENLEELFRNAKDRFPDVVWEVGEVCGGDMMKDVDMDIGGQVEEVWGHKAIVYARAPPSFQTRYFSFRQAITLPTGEYTDDTDFTQPHASSPSPSPSTTTTAISQQQQQQQPTTSLLRLTSSINSTLFSNELEYLYTGKGFGEAFEFLFDSDSSSRDRHLRGVDNDEDDDDADPEALRIDKLRKDLVFMWRSRLYSDVRIALTGNFSSSSPPGDTTTAIFSSHRFILVSRSPYFHNALFWQPTKQQPGDEPPTLNLPSPPFTPASLHFTLGFMYTGTLIFSHRSYDLSTAFAILRAALYLDLNSLHDEIQARIVQEMLHGLCHAFIPFEEYDRLTNGKWGTGGCRCRQCARRVPRVLEFALEVENRYLENGSRRALVGLFGEGWVHQEFSSLPLKTRETLLRGLAKRTRPLNVFPLLFAAEHGLGKLGVVIEPWGDISREMILSARKTIDDVLCKESEACFNSDEWMELMEADGVVFEDGEKVEWAMAAVLRGVKDAYAASLYQTLVSSILLRPHPTDVNAPLLPATSHVRVQVEQTRLELLKWIGKRWLGIRQERGFDALEGWALKEISDHIEVPIDDLLNPLPQAKHHSPKRTMTTTSTLLRPTSNHPHTSKVDTESDIASSMRVSVLSRSLPMRQTSTGTTNTHNTSLRDRDRENGLSSSASSIRSALRSSTDSYASAISTSTIGAMRGGAGGMSPARMIVKETKAKAMKDRPDSKLTPSVLTSPSILEPEVLEEEEDRMEEEGEEGEGGEEGGEYDDDESRNGDEQQHSTSQQTVIKKVLITRASLASVASRSTLSSLTGSGSGVSARTLSSASSARSQSTAGKSSSVASSRFNINTPSTPKSTTVISPRSSSSRPQRISTTGPATSRPTSSLSTATDSTYRTASPGGGGGGGLHTPTRIRRTSGTSTISIRTPPSRGDKRSSPVSDRARRISGASVSSVASSVKTTGAARIRTTSTGKKPVGGGGSGGVTPPLPDPKKLSPVVPRPGSIHSSISGGSTVSNSTPKRVVRKMVLKKKKSGDVEPTTTPEVPVNVKEGTEKVVTETEKDTVKEKDNKEMDVDMDVEIGKEVVSQEVENNGNSLPPPIVDDIIEEDPSSPNTPSSMTTSEDPIPGTETGGISEHKKSSSSASTSSVATLKRKGSADTIKTVISSSPPIVVVDAPLIKQLPPTPSSPYIPSSPLLSSPPPSSPLPQQQQQPLPPPPPILQHQSSTLKPPTSVAVDPKAAPQGATLDIGIPCIIASKRKRFKAYARYIGEVQGESGAWVGVEVPIPFGDSWTSSSAGVGSGGGGGDAGSAVVAGDNNNKAHGGGGGDDRQWNDGTWGGIRYFEIGGMGGSEWDYGSTNEDRASRRRRVDGGGGGSVTSGGGGGRGDKGILKREGDQMSISSASEMRRKKLRSVSPSVSDMSGVETRGLFVRPQQVLYVVDAVGADL